MLLLSKRLLLHLPYQNKYTDLQLIQPGNVSNDLVAKQAISRIIKNYLAHISVMAFRLVAKLGSDFILLALFRLHLTFLSLTSTLMTQVVSLVRKQNIPMDDDYSPRTVVMRVCWRVCAVRAGQHMNNQIETREQNLITSISDPLEYMDKKRTDLKTNEHYRHICCFLTSS